MSKIKILVTGACGVTSRSVVRSLNKSEVFSGKCEFIGTDVCYNEYGIYEGLYSKVYKVPSFNAPNYRSMMNTIIKENNLEYAIIIPEPEALYWSENPFDIKFMAIPPKFSKLVLSKKSLYDTLSHTSIIPSYQTISKSDTISCEANIKLPYPVWIRDYSEGTTSGKGSFLAASYDELKAWFSINHNIDNFMLSEYLPGRNLACFLLYDNGKLLKYGVAQRIDYLMGKVAISGITGNTSKGKLLNDENVLGVSKSAVEEVLSQTSEVMNGLVVVDLKCDKDDNPIVTEINIRHVAFTSSFANAGLNFSEAQMLCLMNNRELINPELTIEFPEDNIILRDVDGVPLYIEHYSPIEIGGFIN